MKRISLFALLLLVFNAGYSQDSRVHNASLDYIVIMLMSLGVGMLIIHVISARQAYKEEAKKEPPVSIINHFHVCGSTAHAGSTAVNDRSSRVFNNDEDNSNKSEVTSSNGSRLSNNMNQTPNEALVRGSELSDYIEGEDDESVHNRYTEENIDEVDASKDEETEQK